jgi:hypothetical protein
MGLALGSLFALRPTVKCQVVPVRYGPVGGEELLMMADGLKDLVSLAHVASRREIYVLRQRGGAIEVTVVSTMWPHASMRAQMPSALARSHLYLRDGEVRLRAYQRGSHVELSVVAAPAGVQLRTAQPAPDGAADLTMPLLTATPNGAPGDALGDTAAPQPLGGWRLLAKARSGTVVLASPTLNCIITSSMGATRGLFRCVASDGPETPLAVGASGATVAVCYADQRGCVTYWLSRGRTALELQQRRAVLLAQELEP